MPLPRPRFEIFSARRGSKRCICASGRWRAAASAGRTGRRISAPKSSGLVKAQQVKNAVIVPVGAKGGFVPKRLPTGNRDAIQAEGVATYRMFMSTMLDITDNLDLDSTIVIPPADVVRHDGDDPYLVVAADKGTATFSDIANGSRASTVSGSTTPSRPAARPATTTRRWASPRAAPGNRSSAISARWTSTSRRTPFTVVGVGDMSGDVFGNGMLRERTIKLVAAFDHRDIFIDPDPDPELSFKERERLFDLPRSSWQDYDRYLISPGGGVFSRSAKEIALSPQARAVLGLAAAQPTPQEVMKAILEAPVDLLWFGGIGTYVRASTESDEAVGDRANDAIRVAGAALALQGDRRRRQSRHDPARPHRGGAPRHPPQHRCDRQFRRRQHLRRRGQPQDRAQPAAARRPPDLARAATRCSPA